MNTVVKVVLAEIWFLLVLPLVGVALVFAFGLLGGLVLYLFLCFVWCWELYAYCHYRCCRQEELLHVLQAATATKAPVEGVLAAYLEDRPRQGLHSFWAGLLLFFIFPGYYWIHRRRRFDARIDQVLDLLYGGVRLDRALIAVPGVVSRETALAVTVGQFTGRLALALHRLPARRPVPLWLELVPRVLYPLLLLFVLLANMIFLSIFVIPKFERIFADFRLTLPASTQNFIGFNRWLLVNLWILPAVWGLLVLFVSLFLFNSHFKWYCPLLGRLYRLQVRGQFLELLGLMLESDRPLPEILDRLLRSRLLPGVAARRVRRLVADLEQGQPLTESLARHGLTTEPMRGLILAAEKAGNLSWALQELGDALGRRCARIAHRLTLVLFPVIVFGCACLIAYAAVSVFTPLIAMIEGVNG
jgi:type II secretory pathway component PulF